MVDLRRRMRRLASGILAALACATPAAAGPPYVTDDPEPTALGHWEVYNFVSATKVSHQTASAAGFDFNYGAAQDLQLTMVVPVEFDSPGRAGLGDIELAAKYRFVHQAPGRWTPDIAVFPRLFAPTASHRSGPARPGLLLPVWVEKDAGPWSVFGGGGYDINPGAGNRNFWQTGVGVSRAIGDRFSLGVEAYHRTADATDGQPFTGVNLGATYRASEHWTLMLSAGPGVENAGREGRYAAYFALQANY